MNLCSIETIKYIRKVFGFRNAKSLGQNFLTEEKVIEAMVSGAEISEEDFVIEIGPGIGVLTRGIAERAGKVVAVELDRNLLPVLDYTLGEYNNVEIINRDILKVDLNKLIEEKRGNLHRVKIMGNLPYYITTPIITGILEGHIGAESLTIMMQREVADRIMASPGTKAYGALSVVVQFYSKVNEIIQVPRESFYPAPKVDSTVLKLELRKEPAVKVQDQDLFFRLVKGGFGQRRKTLLNALAGAGLDKEKIKTALSLVDIDGGRRAETLSLEEFAALSDKFTEIG